MSVKASTDTTPLSRIAVKLHTEGGLQRYLTVGAYSNVGTYTFFTSGLSVLFYYQIFGFTELTGQKVTAGINLNTYGLTGTATFEVTDLPSGATASLDTPTLPIPRLPNLQAGGYLQGKLTIMASQEIAPCSYPVRVPVTLDGVTYTSDPANLTVKTVVFN